MQHLSGFADLCQFFVAGIFDISLNRLGQSECKSLDFFVDACVERCAGLCQPVGQSFNCIELLIYCCIVFKYKSMDKFFLFTVVFFVAVHETDQFGGLGFCECKLAVRLAQI